MKKEINQLKEKMKEVVSDVKRHLVQEKEGENVQGKGKEVVKDTPDQGKAKTHPGFTDDIDKFEKLLDKISLSEGDVATSSLPAVSTHRDASDISCLRAIAMGTTIPTSQVRSSTQTTHTTAATIQTAAGSLIVGTTTEVIPSPVPSLRELEVTASTAVTPVQTGYSLTPVISRTMSSTNYIQR